MEALRIPENKAERFIGRHEPSTAFVNLQLLKVEYVYGSLTKYREEVGKRGQPDSCM